MQHVGRALRVFSLASTGRWFTVAFLALGLQAGACDCGPEPTVPVDETCRFNSECPSGQECDPDSHQCVTATSGYCDVDADCQVYGADLYCETDIHLCVSHHQCGPDNPCPEADQECQVDENTGFRVCVYPGCDDDSECLIELADSCEAGTRARCILRACVCQDACGGPCGDERLCCADTETPTCIDDPGLCSAMTCEPGFVAQSVQAVEWSVDDCGYAGEQCDCQELPLLPLGDIGDPSVLAARSDGSVVVAAYNFGFDNDPNWPEQRYGDLMFGEVASDGQISWQTVDGVPTEPVVAGPSGPRAGVSEPGDDVGRALDLVVDSADGAHIAYWDRSHGALKYARVEADGSIVILTVDDQGDTGRAPAIALDPANDAPRISYFSRRVELADHAEAQLKIAVAAIPLPLQPSQFALHVVARQDLREVPCQGVCPDTYVCQDAPEGSVDFCVVETQDCGGCEAPQVCVSGSCVDVIETPIIDIIPPGVGLFSDLTVRGDGQLVIVAYDSFHGDLLAYRPSDGANILESGASFVGSLLDGDQPSLDPHDVGAHVQIAVSGTTLHLVYNDDSERSIVSASVDADLNLTDRQVLDDGRRPGPAGAWDQHPLSEPVIAMSPSGERSVLYQDGTVQSLWRCVAAAGETFNGCQWLRGGEPGAQYPGSYGFANNLVYLPGRDAPMISTYRFVPVAGGAYRNGIVFIDYPQVVACAPDLYEPNDSQAQAAGYPNASLPGRICVDDQDWFVVPVLAGDNLRARIGFAHAQGDLDIALYDANGTLLLDSTSGSDDEQIDYQSSTAQNLALRIFGFDGASNSYILGIDLY